MGRLILADTSIWIEYLAGRLHVFAQQLEEAEILMHPIVRGELAMGNLLRRQSFLEELGRLPKAIVATEDEVLEMVTAHQLFGKGIGFFDAHLLASAVLMNEVTLWTKDRQLAHAARTLGVACSA